MAVAGDDDVNGNDSNSLESTGQSFPQPRLTGRRKRRHLSDPEFLSWTHSPESTSPSSGHALQHRSFAFEDRRKNVALAHDKITYTNSSRNYGDFSTFIAPQKLHNEDLFASYVAANADIASKGLRGLSGDPDSESIYNLRLHVAARSAPTSAFPSHVSSPHRTSNVDVFHPSFMAPQELHGKLVAHSLEALPATTLRGPDLLPHNLNLFSREWTENKHVDAHPLLPFTGASLSVLTSKQRQSTMLPYAAENKFVPSTKFQWQKGKLIGRGTFGSVFHATNLGTGASCAMKEVDIIPDDPKSSEHVKQLEQEINILSQLHHPNIVQYYGSEIVGNHFYIYMEYVHPGSINKFVREHCGAITESVVRNFTHHILSGLAYLHGTKTIHRDIKGANLLVDASGTVKLADFGMAKILTGQSYDLSLKGSPYWMAPEVMKAVIKKNTNLDLALAVDIWSLGCTIIEMLTGKPPWSEFEGVQAMFKVLHKTPPIPKTLSSEGKDFLQQCFQRNPADRPSAAKLLEHAFVQNMHEQDQDVFAPPKPYPKPISPVVMDESGGPRDRAKRNSDVMPVSMSTRIINKVQKFIGDSCQRYLKHFTG